jgi:hypothetical protein
VLKVSLAIGVAIAVNLVSAESFAQDDGCGPELGCWVHTRNEVRQSASVRPNPNGSTDIRISVKGQNPGSTGERRPSSAAVVETPRGGSLGWPGLSRPASSSAAFSQPVLDPSTGGANIIVGGGPMSEEKLPTGNVVSTGGFAIGGFSFVTPIRPAATTAFSAIGPVPHIDPWSLALSAESEAPAPPITLKSNPDPGMVAIPSWFWVQGYDGQVITHSKTQHASHTECRLLNGVPDCRTVDDSVTVTVHLKPVSYAWDFGDGRAGSRRTFSPSVGLGRPYTDPLHESPVNWSYEFDSRDFVNGFPIKLTISFAGTFEANGSGSQPLRPRDVTWTTGLVMRQVQTINVAPHSLGESSRSSPKR